MKVADLIKELEVEYFTGVPDSQLKELCNYLMLEKGISDCHIIAANEGNAVGLAAGYHLSTGKTPVVYMQNSGLGNVVNPVTSLLNPKVYGIPCIFIIGWRGEPGVHDEPQHIFQGEITEKLLSDLDIDYVIIDKNTCISEIKNVVIEFKKDLTEGKSVAFVIKKGSFEKEKSIKYSNQYNLVREDVIEEIVKVSGEDVIVSTTGKASRELFEIREKYTQGHEKDFLTVGSMGHSSSIALSIALNKPQTRIWCIDGDGASLMHMGSMALVGANGPDNLIHVVINNGAHETVGGMPTVAEKIDLLKIAEGCGYKAIYSVSEMEDLRKVLLQVTEDKMLTFVEVKCCLYSRDDLGRPTTTAKDNKESFMKYLSECK